jgi:hypothetical protein
VVVLRGRAQPRARLWGVRKRGCMHVYWYGGALAGCAGGAMPLCATTLVSHATQHASSGSGPGIISCRVLRCSGIVPRAYACGGGAGLFVLDLCVACDPIRLPDWCGVACGLRACVFMYVCVRACLCV